MQITIHQTHIDIGDFDTVFQTIKKAMTQKKSGIHLFPESFLTGYPLKDLCLNQNFIQKYQLLIEKINQFSLSFSFDPDQLFLLGGLFYDENNNIKNVIYQLYPGKKIKNIYTKQQLACYDIFDESKYFIAGTNPQITNFQGRRIGLLICEDMWSQKSNKSCLAIDYLKDQPLDLIINLSASPNHINKLKERIKQAKIISKSLNTPFIYINQVGGYDELVFDGQSFIVNQSNLIFQAPAYQHFEKSFSLSDIQKMPHIDQPVIEDRNYLNQSLFNLTDSECQSLIDLICFGLQEYARQNKFSNFTIALSGGIDSAIVTALVYLSLKPEQTMQCIYMPSQFSSDLSQKLSIELCNKIQIPMQTLAIKAIHDDCRTLFNENMHPLTGIADENIQSRIRGMLLLARANQINALVINTSNKSELSVGYSTIYGDSVGGISLIGDLYKSEVYQLANYINQKYQLIPQAIIDRPASAELRKDQKDSDSLPDYQYLDQILDLILSNQYSTQQIIAKGFDSKEVIKITQLYLNAEHKRNQFCPILKLKEKGFGFGYRVPITKAKQFYFNHE